MIDWSEMKKYFFWLLAIAFAGIGMFGASFATSDLTSVTPSVNTTDNSYGLKLDNKRVQNIGVAWTNAAPDQKDQDPALLKIIKNTINIALGFLGLITLLILLWSGFKIVTSNGDDKAFTAGMATLKQAAIGMWFIAVSWFLVSMIFWIIDNAVKGWTWA